MDFFVVLERAGYRVARRRRCRNKIGHQHKLTKEDAMAWFVRSFEVSQLARRRASERARRMR
jgi:large subunit ribosomal protein L11e